MKYELTTDIDFLKQPIPDFDFRNPPIDPLELSKNLLETLYHYRGMGLAANQCGLPYRCFVMIGKPEDYVCFNPTIIFESREQIISPEGCLSLPGLVLNMIRPKEIRVRFSIPNGERITCRFEGLTARTVVHECLHLNGKFFFEGISRLKLQSAIKKAKKQGFNYEGKGLFAYCS